MEPLRRILVSKVLREKIFNNVQGIHRHLLSTRQILSSKRYSYTFIKGSEILANQSLYQMIIYKWNDLFKQRFNELVSKYNHFNVYTLLQCAIRYGNGDAATYIHKYNTSRGGGNAIQLSSDIFEDVCHYDWTCVELYYRWYRDTTSSKSILAILHRMIQLGYAKVALSFIDMISKDFSDGKVEEIDHNPFCFIYERYTSDKEESLLLFKKIHEKKLFTTQAWIFLMMDLLKYANKDWIEFWLTGPLKGVSLDWSAFLYRVLETGDIDIVKIYVQEMLKSISSIPFNDESLLAALSSGNQEVVDYVLSFPNPEPMKILKIPSSMLTVQLVKKLIGRVDMGHLFLIVAESGPFECFNLFKEYHHAYSGVELDYDTAMGYAIKRGDRKIVNYFLNHPYIAIQRYTARCIAGAQDIDLVELIIRNLNIKVGPHLLGSKLNRDPQILYRIVHLLNENDRIDTVTPTTNEQVYLGKCTSCPPLEYFQLLRKILAVQQFTTRVNVQGIPPERVEIVKYLTDNQMSLIPMSYIDQCVKSNQIETLKLLGISHIDLMNIITESNMANMEIDTMKFLQKNSLGFQSMDRFVGKVIRSGNFELIQFIIGRLKGSDISHLSYIGAVFEGISFSISKDDTELFHYLFDLHKHFLVQIQLQSLIGGLLIKPKPNIEILSKLMDSLPDLNIPNVKRLIADNYVQVITTFYQRLKKQSKPGIAESLRISLENGNLHLVKYFDELQKQEELVKPPPKEDEDFDDFF